jgi:shikimate dehydrogenase
MKRLPLRGRCGVLGWPLTHTGSPAMHNAAFRALAMEGWRYQRLPVPPALFDETARSLGQAGFVGANVTSPHKLPALALATSATERAREIGAANTLTFAEGDQIVADNTDAPGLIELLRAASELPAHPRALVLGAGGSARAAIWALAQAGASEVSVYSRTRATAETVAAELGARCVPAPQEADLLVNCTPAYLLRSPGIERSASDDDQLNQLPLTFDQVGSYAHVVDLVYRSEPTPLVAAAGRHGADTIDGHQFLLAQGALSFELWSGREAPREVMREALRAG